MSESVSTTYAATAPRLLGAWVFDPVDPAGTLAHFPYARAAVGASTSIEAQRLAFAGRAHPVIEYGELESASVSIGALVPFGDDHDAGVQWWRDAVTARRTINYRDGRGRLYWVGLPGGIQETDERDGTIVAATLERVDYDEAVA